MQSRIKNMVLQICSRQFRNYFIYVLSIIVIVSQGSCKKYLDKKPAQNLAVPSTLSDLQAVLDNQDANRAAPQFLELVADNYYITTSSWSNLIDDIRKTYLWAKDAKITVENGTWSEPYQAIYKANFVLEILPDIKFNESERNDYNRIKGTALFVRAFMFHSLAQLYCMPYNFSANSDLGIVLRKTSDVNSPVSRATVQQTYDQIIDDLKTAIELLPVKSLYATRPNKAAAYGLLARTYLSMRKCCFEFE
jgi:hypothetical protein